MATLRESLAELLAGDQAHLNPALALSDLALELQGQRPAGLPYSPWELLEHLRLTQHDIVEFITNPDYQEPDFPAGYWPATASPPRAQAWQSSRQSFLAELDSLIQIAQDSSRDLEAMVPWGSGQTLMRELLLAADHNSYHLGQMVILRRLLGTFQPVSPERPL
jgi:uncharacterized damage-inducible protein DinB